LYPHLASLLLLLLLLLDPAALPDLWIKIG